MAQSLELNIKTTSDVPQAMEKAKSATVSFSKQVEDIQKKFSTAFKDIFLGFTAPMVLLQGAISMISSAIAKAKQDAKDGIDLIAKGETVYASAEEAKLAQFFKAKRAREEEMTKVQEGRVDLARQFLETPEGKKIAMEMAISRGPYMQEGGELAAMQMMPRSPEFQKRALEAFLKSPEGKAFKPIFEDKEAKKGADFKGPEGFSNVIGVGANPVIEAMAQQTEIALAQLAELQKISGSTPAGQGDFTKGNQSK